MSTPNKPSPNPHLDALLAEAGWVLKLAKRLARDQAAAEDIAQSTLALALEKRPAMQGGWVRSQGNFLPIPRDLRYCNPILNQFHFNTPP